MLVAGEVNPSRFDGARVSDCEDDIAFVIKPLAPNLFDDSLSRRVVLTFDELCVSSVDRLRKFDFAVTVRLRFGLRVLTID